MTYLYMFDNYNFCSLQNFFLQRHLLPSKMSLYDFVPIWSIILLQIHTVSTAVHQTFIVTRKLVHIRKFVIHWQLGGVSKVMLVLEKRRSSPKIYMLQNSLVWYCYLAVKLWNSYALNSSFCFSKHYHNESIAMLSYYKTKTYLNLIESIQSFFSH